MKTILSMFVLVLLALSSLAGCSNNKPEEKSLTENSVELEVEKSTEISEDNSKLSKVDMKNVNALYEFTKKEITSAITKENFNYWKIYHYDITGDGTEEALLVNEYGENWHEKMEVISGDKGEYHRVPSDIPLGKNGTVPDFKDGFLVVETSTGGSGIQSTSMNLYVYDGSKIASVLPNLEMYYRYAASDADIEKIGKIEGDLRSFVHTVTKNDKLTGRETIESKTNYTYNEEAMSFSSDADKVYDYKVKDGNLQIIYGDDGVTAVEANKVYEVIKDDGQGTFTIEEKLYVLKVTKKDNNKLYFTVKAPDYSVGEVEYYIDIPTNKIYWVGSQNSEEAVEESEAVRLSGFNNETIRGSKINYNEYSAVIIPWYPEDGANYTVLPKMPFINDPEGRVIDFAVFGKLEDFKITLYESMDSKGEEYSLGELENSIVNIHTSLPSDMSYYKVTGKVHVGEGFYEEVEFSLDDMRDPSEYDIHKFK